jgi:hypothetical protein
MFLRHLKLTSDFKFYTINEIFIMINVKKISISLLLALSTGLIPLQYSQAQPEGVDPKFNPNNIINDEEMLNYKSMTLDDIQKFLENHNSYLATYSTTSAYGKTKKASEIIYDASYNNYDCEGANLETNATEEDRIAKCKKITTINPKFLLVLLQKEQSLIEEDDPRQSQLDWATGYGCPDGWVCNSYWKGFGKQVNSAALQFLAYLKEPGHYPYQKNKTYTIKNASSVVNEDSTQVTPVNQATASLYNYTPHVYNGNYSFYKLWKRYFPSRSYPNGSLLKAEGETGVWLIQDGKKRPFTTKIALISRFDERKVITVSKTILDSFEKGTAIKFANYSLIRSSKGEIFLLVDDKKRKIIGDAAFKKIGFNPEEIMDASSEDIANYISGIDITSSSIYPAGALLQSKKTGGVFWVQEATKAPLLDKVLLKTKFKDKKIKAVDEKELELYKKIEPVLFGDGELLRSNNSSAVYLIVNQQKRAFSSGEIFEKLGYKWENIITISPQLLSLYANGDPINDSAL